MRRILFVKTSSLGDVVHHCPAVSDAARRLPAAEIHWVVEEPFAEVAVMHRAVRRVIPVALRRWRRAPWSPAVWGEIASFRKAISLERYDAVIDSQGLLKSALVCALAAGTKHGMGRASAREPLAGMLCDIKDEVAKGLHAVERNRRLTGSALGYTLENSIDYGLQVKNSSLKGDAAAYAVFLTMTSRADKLWPNERWIELGRALGVRVVLPWGTEAEKIRAEAVSKAMGNAAVPARMSLLELAGIFQKANAVIGVGTGLTHLAAAVGARTVGTSGGSVRALADRKGVW